MIQPTADTEVSAGETQLYTADGNFYNVNAANSPSVIGAIQPGIGDISTRVYDQANGSPLAGVPVSLARTNSVNGPRVAQSITDSQGYANFPNMAYGPYSAIVDQGVYNK